MKNMQVKVSILYHACAINITITSTIEAEPTKAIKCLDYFANHLNAENPFHISGMMLKIHSDVW